MVVIYDFSSTSKRIQTMITDVQFVCHGFDQFPRKDLYQKKNLHGVPCNKYVQHLHPSSGFQSTRPKKNQKPHTFKEPSNIQHHTIDLQ